MANSTVRRNWAAALVASSVLFGTMATLSGCRVSEDNIHRWGTTEHGPDKLVAVLSHDKYDWSLRVSAAMELVGMKPRGGRRVGIQRLIDALAQLGPDERKHVLDGLVPKLVEEIKKAPPAAGAPAPAGAPAAADTSIPFKDAAFGVLSHEPKLVSDENAKKTLTAALVEWCLHDFERRLDNSSQMFGIEQMLRFIGPEAVRGLPSLVTAESTKVDRIAGLVADLGDSSTKDATAQKLVELAKATAADAWIAKKRPLVEEANKASNVKATPDQVAKQVAQYQDEELQRVFGALKRVGQRPAVEYCLGFAGDKAQNEKRRQSAVAALEGRLDRNNPADVQRILTLASADDTPDSVRDLAFQRVGEMPRELVVSRLYDLFPSKKWKVRWVAAGTVLKMSSTTQLAEFMGKLPVGAPGLALTEPLSYGAYIDKLQVKDGKKPQDVVLPFLREGSPAARLTALGWFYAVGKASDVATIAALESDTTPVPKIDDPEAKWQCDVPKGDGKETETKPISNVGEFVKYCVEPAMKGRT